MTLKALKHRCTRTLVAFTAAMTIFVMSPAAHADEVDDLLSRMEEVSRDASAKNEEVKTLEDEITQSQQRLVELELIVAQATEAANRAKEAEKGHRIDVNSIAGAKYRTSNVDPITNVMGAENPQNAIDRAAYLGTLSANAESAVDRLRKATEDAAQKQSDAARAVAEQKFKRLVMQREMQQLEREKADLEVRTEEIMRQVESLTPEQRTRWIEKNGPVEGYDIQPVDSGSPAANNAVGAALSKLGAPYGWGAAGPDVFDCSGLVYWAYQQQGITVPRTSQAQMVGGTPVSMDELQPGDVIGYYPGATHVGIYVGNGMLAHASDYGVPLQVVPVDSMPVYGARRYS